jgi:hypothetical protein
MAGVWNGVSEIVDVPIGVSDAIGVDIGVASTRKH